MEHAPRRRFLQAVGAGGLAGLAGCGQTNDSGEASGQRRIRSFRIASEPNRTLTLEAVVSRPDDIDGVTARWNETFDWWGGSPDSVEYEMAAQGNGRYALTIPIDEQYPGDLRAYKRIDGDLVRASVEVTWEDGTTKTTDTKRGHAVHQQALPPKRVSSAPYESTHSLLIPGNQTNYREAVKHKHHVTAGVRTQVVASEPNGERFSIRLEHENPENGFVNELWGYPNSFILVLYRDDDLRLESVTNHVDGRSYGLEGIQAAKDYVSLFTSPPATVTQGLYDLAKGVILDQAIDVTEHMRVEPETENVDAYRAVYLNFAGDNPLMFDTVSSFSSMSLSLTFAKRKADARPQVEFLPALTGQHVTQGYTNHLLEYRRHLTVDLEQGNRGQGSPTPTQTPAQFEDQFEDGTFDNTWRFQQGNEPDDETIEETDGHLRHDSPQAYNHGANLLTKEPFQATGTVVLEVRQRQLLTDYWATGFGMQFGNSGRVMVYEKRWGDNDDLRLAANEFGASKEIRNLSNPVGSDNWLPYAMTVDLDAGTVTRIERGSESFDVEVDIQGLTTDSFRFVLGGGRGHDTLYDVARIRTTDG